jgi:hypothetical protein
VKAKIEQQLEMFIKYAKAQVCCEFPEFDFGERLSLDGAAMLLTWLGLAKPIRDADGEVTWVATSSFRTLKNRWPIFHRRGYEVHQPAKAPSQPWSWGVARGSREKY